MRRTKRAAGTDHGVDRRGPAACALLLSACFPLCSTAQQPGQKVFSSAEEASNALVVAAENNDEKSLIILLGSRREGHRLLGRRHRGREQPG